MEQIKAKLNYEWKPFTFNGSHLTFNQHVTSRLNRNRCSHWGPAVYKWEGIVDKGRNAGKIGVLIGETGDLRQRIKQYVSGNQERGNKLWRDTFLTLGDIRLYVLNIQNFLVDDGAERTSFSAMEALTSTNTRLVLEQLLVLCEVGQKIDDLWIVNARR